MTASTSHTPNTPAQSPQHLVLLGAGHAHLQVLAQLAAQPLPGAAVTLIAPHPRQLVASMVPGFVAGHYPLDDCVIPLEPLIQRSGVRWLQRSVAAVDAQQQTVQLDDGSTVAFDWLSVNTDPVQNREQIEQDMPGARGHALFIRPADAFAALWPRVVEMADTRPLRIAMIGAGAGSLEMALAVRHRLPHCAVTLVCGHQPPGGNHTPAVHQRLQAILKKRNVTVLQDVAVGLRADSVQLGCGADLACDVPLLATRGQPPQWLAHSGLALDDHGFLAVDKYQRSTSHERVFAAMDASTRVDRALARSGIHAARAGTALVHNLAAVAAGTPLKPHQPPQASLNLLACGDRYALGTWKQFSAQGWWLWWFKNWIDRRFTARYSLSK
jgi:NADH dehydrogenase FAD-containing subunit